MQRAAVAGTLEWRDDEGGRLLGWLLPHAHCALIPLEVPDGTAVRWRRQARLHDVEAGDALWCSDDDEVAACVASERAAAARADATFDLVSALQRRR